MKTKKTEEEKHNGVKVSLTVIIPNEDKILLGLRQNAETANDMWAFPGGKMEYGEEIEAGATREVKEETGLIVEEIEFLDKINEPFLDVEKHYVSLVHIARKWEGKVELREPNKCLEWKWFHHSLLPTNTFLAVREMIEKHKNRIFLIV